MKNKNLSDWKARMAAALAACTMGWVCWNAQNVCRAQSAPVNLSPQVQEIVRLNRAHLGDDVITAYIKNSGASYHLSADDILYLNSQGISQGVITALLQAAPPLGNNPLPGAPPSQSGAAGAPPPAYPPGGPPVLPPGTPAYAQPSPPPTGSEIDPAYFQAQLAPYGSWVNIAPYGQVWRPAEVQRVPDWRPYFNTGHWEYTDAGWFWHSDYPWGDIVFHYGRWAQDPALGWFWIPGYNWGPAWVCWRHSEGFFGWAPLPPSARFEVGVGLTFGGRVVTDFDFGLPFGAFAFVPYDHFWEHDLRAFVAPPWRVPALFRASIVLNGYHFVGGRFVVDGFGRERVAALTHHEIRAERVAFHDSRIAHEVEAQRARALDVQRGSRGRPGEERRQEERREGNR